MQYASLLMLLREQDPARQAFKLTLWGHVIFRAGQWACANFLRLRQCDYILKLLRHAVVRSEGWEFAHLISERIARFLFKNERMSDLLKKMCDSLICSFLVSKMSDSLTSLTKKEEMSENERFAHFSIIFFIVYKTY